MSDITNPDKWIKIDNNYEEIIINDIRFVREIGDTALSLDCPICKKLIGCIEDVEYLKKENCCETCYNDMRGHRELVNYKNEIKCMSCRKYSLYWNSLFDFESSA